jgi:hypothetical protein
MAALVAALRETNINGHPPQQGEKIQLNLI